MRLTGMLAFAALIAGACTVEVNGGESPELADSGGATVVTGVPSASSAGGPSQGVGGALGGTGGTPVVDPATSGGTATEPTSLADFTIDGAPATMQCVFCHGPLGEGTALAPNIQHPVRDFYSWVVRNGRMGHPDYPVPPGFVMPSFDATLLPDEALVRIFDFLDTPPQPATGEGLYLDYCAHCHGFDARGGTSGVGLRLEERDSFFTVVRSGADLSNYATRTRYMSRWLPTEITELQIGMIATYVNGL